MLQRVSLKLVLLSVTQVMAVLKTLMKVAYLPLPCHSLLPSGAVVHPLSLLFNVAPEEFGCSMGGGSNTDSGAHPGLLLRTRIIETTPVYF